MDALILGTGLIGASVGAGLRRQGWKTAGWDPSEDALRGAMEMGGLDEVAPGPDAAGDVDLVVLAGPVQAIIAILPELSTGALVTDVAGVKTSVVAAAGHLPHFVGSHPMAGRESSGPGAASAAMFEGASWIMTTDGADGDDIDRLANVVESLGAHPLTMTADQHDLAMAAVSHVPQVLASALVNLVARDKEALDLAAGGFRDLTRIALSDPSWWTDILAENRRQVSDLIRALAGDLETLAAAISAGDRTQIADTLDSARRTRQTLSAPVSAVRVLLEDRPGEIALVGHALAESGVDVRDLQLRHATRGGGGVLTLSVRPGQEAVLAESLKAEGFRLVD